MCMDSNLYYRVTLLWLVHSGVEIEVDKKVESDFLSTSCERDFSQFFFLIADPTVPDRSPVWFMNHFYIVIYYVG